jgi:hypothetical protein
MRNVSLSLEIRTMVQVVLVLYCTYSNKYAHMSMCVTSMHVHTVLPVVTRTSMYQMSLHPVIERSDSEENSTIIFPMARGIV